MTHEGKSNQELHLLSRLGLMMQTIPAGRCALLAIPGGFVQEMNQDLISKPQ